jgi:hypothetical protein
MKAFPRSLFFMSVSLAVAFFTVGCHGNQNQNAANTNTASPDQSQDSSQDSSQDPATANLVPISNASSVAPQDNGMGNSDQSAPSPDQYQQDSNQPGYGEEAAETAPDPPPPLPDYDQPPCPGDDYLWTPGYWDYAPAGYYWVPGAWVAAPYQGALWTPGYWGYDRVHRHYAFYRGYWGPHIGYYGGVNYGFGFVGFGYQGGYWNRGHFDYNRSVNRVDVNVVHNVYNRTVINNTYINNTRISYNGGNGGLNARPRPAELAAIHEQHAPPMTAQVQHAQDARTNRADFASMNHGRPAVLAVSRPLAADHNIRPPAQVAARNFQQQQPQRAPEQQARPEQRPPVQQARPEERPPVQQARPEQRTPVQQARPEQRTPEPMRSAPPAENARPNRPENQAPVRNQPQREQAPRNETPQQQPNNHPANRPEERAPQPRPTPPPRQQEARPAPQPRPQPEHQQPPKQQHPEKEHPQ